MEQSALAGLLRIVGTIILAVMTVALFYAAYISLANYAGISV